MIAGPSGSGKSTLIRELFKFTNWSIINVDVSSAHSARDYSNDLGRTVIDIDAFIYNFKQGKYEIINEYDGKKYGYSIPPDFEQNNYILDYAGEYPSCTDLARYLWKGLLVLPPSKEELKRRLCITGRQDRILSACLEYEECLSELKTNLYANWTVFISLDLESLRDFVKGYNGKN